MCQHTEIPLTIDMGTIIVSALEFEDHIEITISATEGEQLVVLGSQSAPRRAIVKVTTEPA